MRAVRDIAVSRKRELSARFLRNAKILQAKLVIISLRHAKRLYPIWGKAFLARRKRFELLTFGSVDQRSIQLS